MVSKKINRNNKNHQMNIRLTEMQYKKVSDMSEKSGIRPCDIVRNLIEDGEVNVRYDAKKVIENLTKAQSSINQSVHSIMSRIALNEQKITSLERLQDLNLKQFEPPFRINLEDVACELKEIKKDMVEIKMKADKEMTDCVDF